MTDDIAPDVPRLLTPAEAAEVLRCSSRTVRRLWQSHQISGVKFGYAGLRFTPEDLAEFIQARRVAASIAATNDYDSGTPS